VSSPAADRELFVLSRLADIGGPDVDGHRLVGQATAEIHDYHDTATSVLAFSLAKRAPGYTSLGFPDPRRLTPTPSAPTAPAGKA
jgi:hypothetical protein